MKRTIGILFGLLAAGPSWSPAFATNGMCLEGYGPIALGLGGASAAHDVGTGAMMGNPATLGLAGSRFELALGFLGPRVDASFPAMQLTEQSAAKIFAMPALGYVRGTEKWTFGLGAFGQGGMGTDYGSESFLSMNPMTGQPTDLTNTSTVSVARMIAPLTYRVNEQLVLGGSLDLVYAGLDMEMLVSGAQFGDMMDPTQQTMGTATPDATFGALLANFAADTLHYAHLAGNDPSAVKSATTAWGFGAKLGLVFAASENLSIGASYQTKTSMADLEGRGAMIMAMANAGQLPAMAGNLAIVDFEWPATAALGFALNPTPKLLVAADMKYVAWADVMKDFRLRFDADEDVGGGTMEMTLFQNWEDQMVLAGGAQYQMNDDLALRLGFNHSANPVPNAQLNPLFPAIVENHLTAGAGWSFSPSDRIDLALSHGFEIEQTNTNPLVGVTSTHSQNNFQISYTRAF